MAILAIASLAACDQFFRLNTVPDPGTDAPPGDPCVGLSTLTCPGGTSQVFACGDRCFATCTAELPNQNAVLTCTSWDGGRLALLEDADTNACVKLAISSSPVVSIGLYQANGAAAVDQDWRWSDGVALGFADWGLNEPEDGSGTEAGNEQCAEVDRLGWHDVRCIEPHQFLCQHP